MSKDHTPSGFDRPSGYKSDLEIAETGPNVKSINTSFGSKNHNAYIMRNDKTHEHFYYNPQTQKSGWHGHNYETRNNHQQLNIEHANKKGETTMEKSNSFIESLKVDQATIDRCNEVSKNAAQKANVQITRSQSVDGGRERGDSGPGGSLGRESGYKSGESNSGHEGNSASHSSSSNGSPGHSPGGENSSGSHGNGGEGSGGQGSCGGHGSGGQGGGH